MDMTSGHALNPEALDSFAHEYYLNGEVATIDLEEKAQLLAVDRIVSAVADCDRVLEMGFGTGLTTRELVARGVGLELLEGSPVLVEEARRRHSGLVVHEAMFEDFVPAVPYDAVLAMHVLEHVDDPRAIVGVIRRWLRPGGTLIAVVPNAESLHRRIAVEMGLHDKLDDLSPSDVMVGHQRVYTLDWLKKDVESMGFTVDLEFGFLLKTVPNSMMLSYPPAMVSALNTISDRIPARDLANIAIRARKTA
jgi:SAM-dependent methyltransferase